MTRPMSALYKASLVIGTLCALGVLAGPLWYGRSGACDDMALGLLVVGMFGPCILRGVL